MVHAGAHARPLPLRRDEVAQLRRGPRSPLPTRRISIIARLASAMLKASNSDVRPSGMNAEAAAISFWLLPDPQATAASTGCL